MTVFPENIQTFQTLMDVTASDGEIIKRFQEAMENGDLASARDIFQEIPNGDSKIINAELLNTMNDTIVALERYYKNTFSNGYVISETQPTSQTAGDYWFKIIGEGS